MNQNTLVVGSLNQVSQQSQRPLAELFVDVECVIVVDVSGSMGTSDSRDGKTRWQVAGEELVSLQRDMPGKLAMFAFSDSTQFAPSGILPELGALGAGTGMANALGYVRGRGLDIPGIRIILISDGEPDSRARTLDEARKFTVRIDTIYVGPEARPRGRDFLAQLARESGGIAATADRVKELAATTKLLLTA